MSLPVSVQGTNGTARIVEAKMHVKDDTPVGLIVYTEPFREHDTQLAPFINSEFGTAMNIDASFGGTPINIHDGTDTVAWTGSNITGTKVTFDSTDRPLNGTKSVKVANPAINNTWQFDQGSYVTTANYTAITLNVNIDKDWSTGDSISLYAWDVSGANIVGTSVLIEDYIDEASFDTWQAVIIPFSDLGLVATDFDAIRMENVFRDGGKSPTFYIDDICVQETGNPTEYKTETPTGITYRIDSLRLTLIDNVASTLADGTTPALSYNKLLGLSALTNGVLLQRTVKDVTTFSLPIRQISDLISIGFNITNIASDGTNTILTLDQNFPKPLIVYGGENSYLSLTVSDDLSSLVSFTAVARGSVEIVQE